MVSDLSLIEGDTIGEVHLKPDLYQFVYIWTRHWATILWFDEADTVDLIEPHESGRFSF